MIRPGRPADLPSLRRLQRLLPAPTPALLAAVPPAQLLVSVTAGDAPVGYLLPVPGDDLHVAEAVVDPDHRREGRGTRLLEAAFDRAEPDQRVTLLVAADNEAALSLYRELGFETVETRPDAYADRAGLFMARE